jgi:hypothetical protein
MPSSRELKYELTREPGELIVVPPYATVGELKEAVQSAMRDTYFIMEQFVVTGIEDMEGMEDEIFIPALIRLAPCRSMPLCPPGEDPNPTLAIATGERSDSPRGKRKLGSYAISREQRSNLLLPLGPTNNNLFSYTIISVLRYAPTSRGMTLVMPLFRI